MRARFAALSLAALCVSSIPVSNTADPTSGLVQDPQDKRSTSQGFVLEAGEHHMSDVLNRASKYLNRNYLFPAQEFAVASNTIILQKSLNLDAVGCEEVLSQLMYSKGFAVTPIDVRRNLYEVIYMRGARRPEIASRALSLEPEDVERKSSLQMYVITAVHLKNIDAAKASQQLRPFLAAAGAGHSGLQVGNAGTHQTILLQGFAPQVAMAIRLLRQVDQPQESVFPSNVYSSLSSQGANLKIQAKTIEDLQRRLAIVESRLTGKK